MMVECKNFEVCATVADLKRSIENLPDDLRVRANTSDSVAVAIFFPLNDKDEPAFLSFEGHPIEGDES